MKTDLEILVLGLMLFKIITSLRLTRQTTVDSVRIDALIMDAKAMYMLAYLRSEEHNVSDKKSVFGGKFFYLYMFFTRLPFVLNNPERINGLYCAINNSTDFWKHNGVFIFTGFNKQDGMTLLESKRITTYRILSLVIAMSHAPKGLNIKNAEKHLDKLMTSVFTYATTEHLDLEDTSIPKLLRADAIKSIYRMVDLIKQISCKANSNGKVILNDDNIAHVMDRPNYDSVTALGHNMEVVLARSIANTEIHRVFDKQYK